MARATGASAVKAVGDRAASQAGVTLARLSSAPACAGVSVAVVTAGKVPIAGSDAIWASVMRPTTAGVSLGVIDVDRPAMMLGGIAASAAGDSASSFSVFHSEDMNHGVCTGVSAATAACDSRDTLSITLIWPGVSAAADAGDSRATSAADSGSMMDGGSAEIAAGDRALIQSAL